MQDEFNGLSGAAALVSKGAELVRVENESMMQIATTKPRNEAKILKQSLMELDIAPELAEKAFYSIPYKEKTADGKQATRMVQGPSIKTAMSLCRRWGNCTTAARITNEDPDGWDIEAVFIDLETNFRIARPFRASKHIKRKDGSIEKLDPQRQLMAFQSGVSKGIRNAVLAGLPAYFVNSYFQKAKEMVGGKQSRPANKTLQLKTISAFEKLRINQTALEKKIGKKISAWTGEDIATLRGLFNAINDNMTTAEEVFAEPVSVTPARQSDLKKPPNAKGPEAENPAASPSPAFQPITPDQVKQLQECAKLSKVNLDSYLKGMGIEDVKAIPKNYFKEILDHVSQPNREGLFE